MDYFFQTLPKTLASKIGPNLLLGTNVSSLDFSAKGSHSGKSWRLGFAMDGEKKTRREEFDAVILTVTNKTTFGMRCGNGCK